MRRLSLILGLMLLFGLLLTACGSPASASGSNSINMTISEFKFEPSSFTVSAGKQVTVNLKNSGTVPHTFTLMSKPVNGAFSSADQANVLFDSGQIQPGASKTVTFTAPTSPGTYEYVCTVPGHLDSGMKGEMTVQ